MSYNSKYTGAEVESLLDAANGKQDKIEDLDAIRSGAAAGATALQSVPAEYITESELEQKGYLTAVPSEYVTETELMWVKAEGEAGVRLKGTNGTATGNLAISAGDDKTASDGTAFPSAASGDHAVAFGYGNTCAGRSTLAQGLYNIVNGKDSVAFGQRNTVNGDQAFAAGQQNEVTTRLGVTIGYQNKATNTNSIAIGYKNESKGSGSVALGDTCESGGTSSTAMGYKTKATGAYSATFGENTQATNNGEVAMGVYNKSTTSTDTSEQTAFSFGIGTSDTNRANAFEIKKNGDVYIGNELLSEYVTESELSAALANKVDKVTGKGLSTEDFTTALKTKLEGLNNYNDTEISNAVSSLQTQLNTLVSGNANDAINSFNEIIAFLEGIKDTQDLSSIIASIEQQIAGKMDKVTLATVATSGSYNDLSNKPTIPAAVTESTVSGWGFTKNTGTYSKPSGGIPKTDLASAVQTSLGKADTALQSVPNTYATYEYVDNKLATKREFYRTGFTFMELLDAKYSEGIITEARKAELAQAITAGKTIVVDYGSGAHGNIIANATLEGSELTLQIVHGNELVVVSTFLDGDSITHDDITHDYFVVQTDYQDSLNGLEANKQDKLVSGTNIKTINGQSLIGSGDITIGTEGIYEVDVPYYEGGNILGITTEVWNKLLVTPTISVKLSNTAFKITLNKTDLGLDNLLVYAGPSISLSTGVPLVVTVIFSGDGENFVGIPPYSCTSTYFSVPVSTSQLENDSNFVSSDNLKTINGQSLVGSGDITIGGDSGGEKEVIHTSSVIELLQPNKIYIYEHSEEFEIQALEEPETEYAEYHVIFSTPTENSLPSIILPANVMWANGVAPDVSSLTCFELSIVYWAGIGNATFNAVLTPFNYVK